MTGSRRVRLLLLAPAVVMLAAVLVQTYLLMSRGFYLDHPAGSWAALADDLRRGMFYRPLFDEHIGYGGTRYMPLQFSLHAGLTYLVGDPIVAGFALSSLATAALVAGLFVLLRRLGLSVPAAAGFALCVFAGYAARFGLATIRGDVLASALTIWGLAAAARIPRSPWAAASAAGLFTLAFSAKLTALHGALAVILWLIVAREARAALRFGLFGAGGVAAVLGVTSAVSGGRFIENFAIGGDVLWKDVVAAPLALFRELTLHDIGGVLFCCLAGAAILARGRRAASGLPTLFFGATFAVTLLIFSQAGTTTNHLLDLEVASIVVVAAAWRDLSETPAGDLVLAAAGLTALLSLSPIPPRVLHPPASRLQEARSIQELVGPGAATILSEDPLVPIIAGQRPYVSDAFMLLRARVRRPHLADDLFGKIRRREFGAVVLLTDVARPLYAGWYDTVHFGPGFAEAILDAYTVARRGDYFVVYLPRDPGAAIAAPGGAAAPGARLTPPASSGAGSEAPNGRRAAQEAPARD